MKILELRSENVKRITLVEVKPGDASLVKVGGRNMQGKSSVLDSVGYALGGEKLVPAEPIRRGETRAEVYLDLGDLRVTRTFTRGDRLPCNCGVTNPGDMPIVGDDEMHTASCSWHKFGETRSSLTVKNKDGAKYPSPQAMLDKLASRLAFDPLAFYKMKPKDQNEALRKLLKLDFSELDRKRKEAAELRLMAKRAHGEATLLAEAAGHFPEAPATEIPSETVVAVLKEAEKLRESMNAAARAHADAARAEERFGLQTDEGRQLIDKLKSDLARAEARQIELMQKYNEAGEETRGLFAAYEERKALVPSTEAIEKRLAEIEQTNKRVRANTKRQEQLDKAAKHEAHYATRDKEVNDLDAERERILREAAYPVPGLGLSNDGVTFNGIEFAEASGAERLRVSVAMGLAMNSELKVLLVRDGSLLDEDGQRLLAEMAEAAGAQVWLEVVGEGEGMAVVMEDGHAKG